MSQWQETVLGKIPINWDVRNIDEIKSKERKSIISGPFGSNISSKFFVNDGIPVIRGNNLSLKLGTKFVDDGFVFISEEKANELNTWAIKDDLIFTAAGTIGQVGILNENTKFEKYIISNKQLRVRLDKSIAEPLFVYYWFACPQMIDTIIQQDTGSTVPLINLSVLKRLEITLPPLPEQRAIAGVLSSLDDKIDLLHRQNKTLEALAETLWRKMFVEDVKEDWEETKLNTLIDIVSGYNHSINEIREFGDYLLSMGSIIKSFGIDLNNTRFIDSKNINSSYLCKTGDIIITTRDITQDADLLGSPGIIPKYLDKNNIYVGSNLYKLKIKKNLLNSNLLYWLLRSELYRAFVKKVASGTSVLMLKKSDLMNFSFKLPPNNILKECENRICCVQDKLENNFTQVRSLTRLRDSLLPKLMSGEVRVRCE